MPVQTSQVSEHEIIISVFKKVGYISLLVAIAFYSYSLGDLIQNLGDQQQKLGALIQELQLKLFATEQALVELQNSHKEIAESVLHVNKLSHSSNSILSFDFWKSIFLSWAPFILRFAFSLIPDIVFTIPYVGTSIRVLVTLYSNVAEQPLANKVILTSFTEAKSNIDQIKAALEVMGQAHNILCNRIGRNSYLLQQSHQDKVMRELERDISNSEVTTGSGMQMESTALPADFFDDIS